MRSLRNIFPLIERHPNAPSILMASTPGDFKHWKHKDKLGIHAIAYDLDLSDGALATMASNLTQALQSTSAYESYLPGERQDARERRYHFDKKTDINSVLRNDGIPQETIEVSALMT